VCDMCPEVRNLKRIDFEIGQAIKMRLNAEEWIKRLEAERKHYISKGFRH
jgi:hypothetical protein